ncbi:MiaB/RimO family radical SAM methylthiotransferase [Termitidicoccus mucosus]|uniref:tRNA-2-methylthio-N(6)-dimethylallyladenosine synthase n=1 Tax=Termitidicoccus mucosus TaxID=1184151 RepID=A0A178IGR3_9BACT|nr:tRNA-2-methylthio-N(6)-dimethylallyladenosine synthase MiaB [Opitutaceae bacterium TSB47]
MNRVYIKTYGCQMNERDSEAVAAMLRARGYRIVGSEDECDIMLLNTCSVRDAAEQKAIGKAAHLRGRKRRQPDFILGILGCMAQNRGAALLDRLPDVDLIVGTQKFHQVPGFLDNLRAAREAGVPFGETIIDIREEKDSQNRIKDHLLAADGGEGSVAVRNGKSDTSEAVAGGDGGRDGAADGDEARQVSAFVSIQQGCDMHCSFCIVPKTRGDERSRPMDDIVREVEALAARGVREVTLLGQIVTSYGRRESAAEPAEDGRAGVSPFVRLLERVHALEGVGRIRFTSPHPRGFRQDLVDAFGRLPKLCECVHLPMQSGSDRILRAMKRPYSRDKYKEIVDSLRAVRPDMYFSTDVIVGFPGETDADFEQTRTLFEACNYDMAYIFKYSVRTGTPAAEMGDQIPDEVKEHRNQVLLEILKQNSLRRNASLVGTTQEVLVEGRDKTGRHFIGRTRGNRVAIFDASPRLAGQFVPLRVERATVSSLYGELVLAGVP